MNFERLEQLYSHVAGLPDRRFTMKCYFSQRSQPTLMAPVKNNECGTAACFAGWTVILFGEVSEDESCWGGPEYAAQLLEITPVQRDWLFFGQWTRDELSRVPRKPALAALRAFIDDPTVVMRGRLEI